MLALVEPLILDQLVDRPHLGCAMLVAACAAAGIDVRLVEGQVAILDDLCRRDFPETVALQLDAAYRGRLFSEQSLLGHADDGEHVARACEELARLYALVVVESGPRSHLNGHLVERLATTCWAANAIYLASLESGCWDVPPVRRCLERIAATGARYVGFSLQRSFDGITHAVRRRVRDELAVPVIAGGPLITRLAADSYAEVLEREAIDYLVTGAGETVLPALVAALEEGRDPASVPNVFYLHKGEVRGHREVLRLDLDGLPVPDFSQCRLDDYVAAERVLPLETARGCTWNRCAFCSHNAGPQPRYQAWSPERVAEILGCLRATYGVRQFALHDLEIPPGRARKLSDAILAAGLDDLSLSGLGRLSRDYRDRRLLRLMRRAGFTSMEWGLESGVQRVLDVMCKGTDVDAMVDVLERAAEVGIANQCFVLFGFPGETEEEARATLDFVQRHRAPVARVIFDVLKVQADSPLGREPGQWGMRREDDGSYSITGGMSRDQADEFCRQAFAAYQFDRGRFTGEPVRSMSSQNVSRMLYPMLRSHRLLSCDEALARIATGRFDGLFPVVLGEFEESVWRPVHYGETPLMNARARASARSLSALEAHTATLADGRRSLQEIRTAVGNGGAAVAEAFLRAALEDGFAVAFACPWPEPGAGVY